MPKDSTHNQLIHDLSQIKTTEKHDAVLKLINEEHYSAALLLGCNESTSDDPILTQLLITLLGYKDKLFIDIHSTHEGRTLNELAIKNRNFHLQFSLDKAGVKASDVMMEQWTKVINDADDLIYKNLKKEYSAEVHALDVRMDALPIKSQLPNNKEDNIRIICIVKLLDHLQKYYSDLNDVSTVSIPLSSFEREVLYYVRIKTVRDYIDKISLIVRNLSDEFRVKHDKLLEPASWLMLEQLGGIFNPNALGSVYILPVEISATRDLSSFNNQEAEGAFFSELLEREQLTEAAVPYLLSDVPDLEILFKNVLNAALATKKAPVLQQTVSNLPNLRAAVRYFLENQYLIDLLNITTDIDRRSIPTPKKSEQTYESLSYWLFDIKKDSHRRVEKIQTKIIQHALLTRMKKIGELLTGKKSDFKSLDGSIDFKALITLRDIICHQDEANNKHLIDSLLQDPDKLKKLATFELHSLYTRIFNFIKIRQNAFGFYRFGGNEQYIASVLDNEKKRLIQPEPTKEEPVVVVTPQRRVTAEDEKKFFTLFDKFIIGADSVFLKAQFQSLFDGSENIPDKKTLGTVFLKPLSLLKKTEATASFEMITIVDKATQKTRTTIEQRESMREQQKENATLLQQEKQAKFHSLDTICELARSFALEPIPEYLMSPVECVDAAIEALDNLTEFLEGCGYLDSSKSFRTLDEWDGYYKTLGKKSLSEFLNKNHELSDALEYNFALLLQYLHVISKYTDAKCSIYLNEKNKSLRPLRNLLEHGDTTRKISNNMEVILPHLFEFIFQLAPELSLVKQKIESANLNTESSSPLIANSLFPQKSKENTDTLPQTVCTKATKPL